jgi:hypothetical protein
MYNFNQYCLQALDYIEDAHLNGYLLYCEAYKQKHATTLISQHARTMIEFGTTSHTDFFTQYISDRRSNPIMCFRLKIKVSASHALRTLLTSGETVIDCGTALMLAHIYACLLALEDRYGASQGQLTFDILFGSAIHETPKIQRLLFSNNTVIAGTKGYVVAPDNNISPLNPFSFLFGFSETAQQALKDFAPGVTINENKYISKYNIGSILCMQGNANYYTKHPAGIDANYNCMYVGYKKDTNQLLVRVFGHGKEPVTEHTLKQQHILSYNTARNADDQFHAAKALSYPDKITLKDIPGISVISNIDVKPAAWKMLLNDPLPKLLANLRQYLNQQLIARNQAMLEDSPSLPSPRVNSYYFPATLNRQQTTVLLFLGAKIKERTTDGMIKMDVESSFLDKAIREQTGLERKIIKKLRPKELGIFKLFYPHVTIEPSAEQHRDLITMPKTLYPKAAKIITNFSELETAITLLQRAYRARKQNLT